MVSKKEAALLKRIEQLEARIHELETRPAQHVHHHYPLAQPYWTPIQPTYPITPSNPPVWEVTCGSMGSSGHQQ
jgi:hypothetical protein